MTTVRTDSVLDAIVERKKADLPGEMARRSLADLRADVERAAPTRDFAAALRRPGIGLIAEIKRASPSKGVLAEVVDPPTLAARYRAGGADAISILTEQHRFNGSLDDLAAARAAVDTPLLRKDFLFDAYHLYQARAAGADAALLIVAMLDPSALRDLIALADAIGLSPLVEVHQADEIDRALTAGADVIGINNRNLHSFEVDLTVTERLRPLIPADRTVVGESGIFTGADVARLSRAGVHAVLVGEALMRAGPEGVGRKIAELKSAVPA